MTFASCEAWVAARFLADLGLPFPNPACTCPDTCPPLTAPTEETPK